MWGAEVKSQLLHVAALWGGIRDGAVLRLHVAAARHPAQARKAMLRPPSPPLSRLRRQLSLRESRASCLSLRERWHFDAVTERVARQRDQLRFHVAAVRLRLRRAKLRFAFSPSPLSHGQLCLRYLFRSFALRQSV